MKGLILVQLATWLGAIAALRYPLIGLNVYVGLAILHPQFLFGFAGDLTGLSQIVGVAVLIGWAVNGFGVWRAGRARPVVVAYILYLLWYLLSSVFALNSDRSFQTVTSLSKLALPFLVGVTTMRGEKDWRPFLWTIVLTQGYVGFEMNLDYLFKGYNMAADGFGGMDNNCFGVSLITCLGPAIALMLSSRGWLGRIAAGTSAALILHTILLTNSRGAMLGMIAVCITLFIMMPKSPKNLAALFLVVALAARFTGPQLLSRYASAFVSSDKLDGSAESRLDLWKDCFKVIASHPILGVGPANWRVISASFGWSEGKSAHSVWVESTAELGIPGGVFLIFFFASAAVRLWPVARARITEENRYEVVLASGVVLSIVGFIVSGQFVSIPGLENPYYVVMLGAAMLRDRGDQRVTVPASVPAAGAEARSTFALTAAPASRPAPAGATMMPGSSLFVIAPARMTQAAAMDRDKAQVRRATGSRNE